MLKYNKNINNMGNGETALLLKDLAFPTEDPKLSSQHPQGCLPPSLTTVPGDLERPLLVSAHTRDTCSAHTICTQNIHTHRKA